METAARAEAGPGRRCLRVRRPLASPAAAQRRWVDGLALAAPFRVASLARAASGLVDQRVLLVIAL